jgi:hypothetical protein
MLRGRAGIMHVHWQPPRDHPVISPGVILGPNAWVTCPQFLSLLLPSYPAFSGSWWCSFQLCSGNMSWWAQDKDQTTHFLWIPSTWPTVFLPESPVMVIPMCSQTHSWP